MSTPASPPAAQQAYEAVKAEILTGTLDGTLVSENEVAGRLGMSRTPVREAFLRLETEGLLRRYPQRGALVLPLGTAQVRELLQARLAVEVAAARLVSDLPALVADLREVIATQRAAVDLAAFLEADTAFDSVVVAAGANGLLTDFYATLTDRHRRLVAVALAHLDASRERIVAEHEGLVDALEAGDLDLFETRLRAHMRSTYAGLTADVLA